MGDFLEMLAQPQFLIALLSAVAVFATILTVAMPMFAQNELQSRMKSVVTEREKIRQRERERLAAEQKRNSLRNQDTGLLRDIVERMKRSKYSPSPPTISIFAFCSACASTAACSRAIA